MPSGRVLTGYALPSFAATPPQSTAVIRAASLTSGFRSQELPSLPRSVVNQAQLPCCVSAALSATMEVLYPNWPQLAPLFHYYVSRSINFVADGDGFLTLAGGLQTLRVQGICRNSLHDPPYTQSGADSRPSADAFADAATRKITKHQAWPVAGASKTAAFRERLDAGRPIVIGFQLPIGYPDCFLDPNFEWRDPDNPSRSDTGHCVLIHGYDDTRQSFHIQDSRGTQEFDHGHWWMGYRVVDSSVIRDAFWFDI